MTINVPFKLLNLTLQEPLVHTPTQYFPCRPLIGGGSYTLGQAFLQAAFVGVNWGTDLNGVWFLAQAPGPNTPSTAAVTSIGFSDTNLAASSNQWIDSWKGSWTVLAEANSSSSSSNTTSPQIPESKGVASVFTAGKIAGVVVGCVFIAALTLLLFLCIRRRNRRPILAAKVVREDMAHNYEYLPIAARSECAELENQSKNLRAELDNSNENVRAELENLNGSSRAKPAALTSDNSLEPNLRAELDANR